MIGKRISLEGGFKRGALLPTNAALFDASSRIKLSNALESDWN